MSTTADAERLAAAQHRVEVLEQKIDVLERQERRIRQRYATVVKELSAMERTIGKELGRGLPILSEEEIQRECPCCGRTG